VAPSPGYVGAAAIARRTAFDREVDGDLAGAGAALTEAIANTVDLHQQGRLLEQKATYVDRTNPSDAQNVLTLARAKNAAVLRPLVASAYQKLSGSDHQAVAATDYLVQRYKDKVEIRMGVEALLEDLRFDPQRTEEFETALVELALHIGLTAERPEHDIGQGRTASGRWGTSSTG